jgi:hypothetical protein
MKTLYMARRQVYPQETVVFGPFSNHKAALACARDSLYPEGAQVETVDLSTISTVYVPTSSYPEWVTKEEVTYYGFQESFQDIPTHLEKELSIEVADIDSFASECLEERPQTVTESMMVACLVTGIDQGYQCMHVITPRSESAMTALVLAQPFDRLVCARGYPDRRILLDMFIQAQEFRNTDDEILGWLHKQAEDIAERFWRRFVIDRSAVPEVDPYQWRF